MQHLFIIRIVVEGNYWDSIIDLEGKWIHRIVHYYQVFQISVPDDSQVLDIIPLLGEYTMLSIHAILDEFMIRINVVQYGICIGLVTGCEDDDLEVLIGFLEAFHNVGSDVNASLIKSIADLLRRLFPHLGNQFRALHQGFRFQYRQRNESESHPCRRSALSSLLGYKVNITFRSLWIRQINNLVFNLFNGHNAQVVLDEL